MLQQQKYTPYWYNPINLDKKFLQQEKDMFKKTLSKNMYQRPSKNYSELIILDDLLRRISSQQNIQTILQRIYGLGLARALKIALLFSFGKESLNYKNLTLRHKDKVVSLVERAARKQFKVKYALQNIRSKNIARLKQIKCYRGTRHILYLPARGQRTHSNAHMARYLSSRTFEYVPKVPSSKVKMLSKFSRRKKHIVAASMTRYYRLLNKHYTEFRKTNKALFKQLEKKNKLGVFGKLHKLKVKQAKLKAKGKK